MDTARDTRPANAEGENAEVLQVDVQVTAEKNDGEITGTDTIFTFQGVHSREPLVELFAVISDSGPVSGDSLPLSDLYGDTSKCYDDEGYHIATHGDEETANKLGEIREHAMSVEHAAAEEESQYMSASELYQEQVQLPELTSDADDCKNIAQIVRLKTPENRNTAPQPEPEFSPSTKQRIEYEEVRGYSYANRPRTARAPFRDCEDSSLDLIGPVFRKRPDVEGEGDRVKKLLGIFGRDRKREDLVNTIPRRPSPLNPDSRLLASVSEVMEGEEDKERDTVKTPDREEIVYEETHTAWDELPMSPPNPISDEFVSATICTLLKTTNKQIKPENVGTLGKLNRGHSNAPSFKEDPNVAEKLLRKRRSIISAERHRAILTTDPSEHERTYQEYAKELILQREFQKVRYEEAHEVLRETRNGLKTAKAEVEDYEKAYEKKKIALKEAKKKVVLFEEYIPNIEAERDELDKKIDQLTTSVKSLEVEKEQHNLIIHDLSLELDQARRGTDQLCHLSHRQFAQPSQYDSDSDRFSPQSSSSALAAPTTTATRIHVPPHWTIRAKHWRTTYEWHAHLSTLKAKRMEENRRQAEYDGMKEQAYYIRFRQTLPDVMITYNERLGMCEEIVERLRLEKHTTFRDDLPRERIRRR